MTNKLALLIGINYNGSKSQLNGCINDVHNMKNYLINSCGYLEKNIKILTDETESKPTAMNILREIGKIIISAYYQKSEHIFIHYSGHGTYVLDKSGDEKDNRDEALVPIDYEKAGLITDDVLHDYFSYLPENCKCVCLFDCCHSGTMLDLKYMYKKDQSNELVNDASQINGNVIMISGCRDVQTSADAFRNGNWSGAMTTSYLDTMKQYNNDVSCFNLLKTMRTLLENRGYEQYPQICSSKKINETTKWECA